MSLRYAAPILMKPPWQSPTTFLDIDADHEWAGICAETMVRGYAKYASNLKSIKLDVNDKHVEVVAIDGNHIMKFNELHIFDPNIVQCFDIKPYTFCVVDMCDATHTYRINKNTVWFDKDKSPLWYIQTKLFRVRAVSKMSMEEIDKNNEPEYRFTIMTKLGKKAKKVNIYAPARTITPLFKDEVINKHIYIYSNEKTKNP